MTARLGPGLAKSLNLSQPELTRSEFLPRGPEGPSPTVTSLSEDSEPEFGPGRGPTGT